MTEKACTRITGAGNALVDILINETDQFLIDQHKEKGGMTYVALEEIQQILSQTSAVPTIVPGGAVCNTIIGVGRLGGDARYIGSRGRDDRGDLFEREIRQCNVEPEVAICDTPTGNCLSVITPDAQRSMFTYLGAATMLAPESITSDMFKDTCIAIIEGYLLFNEALIMAALDAAKKAGCMIALDLSSFEIVNASKHILGDLIKNYVDILTANEDEASAYTGISDEIQAIEKMSKHVDYAALKIGEIGSIVSHNNTVTPIKAQTGKTPVDTTGAGDLWTAGFLFGLAHGYPIEKCGQLASACGYEVCQVLGAQIPEQGWNRIKKLLLQA